MIKKLLKKYINSSDTFHCMVCEQRIPKEYAYFERNGVGICSECIELADTFKSVFVFPGRKNLKFAVAAYPYTGRLRRAFIKYKFENQKAYSNVFSEMLFSCAEPVLKKDDFDLVVPVPLSKQRMNERGYNQSALVAKDLADMLLIDYSEAAVFRVKNTKPQSSVSGNKRALNVKGAFVADATKVAEKRILLVDDIYTMGATMEECAAELLLRGAKSIAGAVIFKTILPEKADLP